MRKEEQAKVLFITITVTAVLALLLVTIGITTLGLRLVGLV
jgi:hypothetical protein